MSDENTKIEDVNAMIESKHNQARVALDVMRHLDRLLHGDSDEAWKCGRELTTQEASLRHKAIEAMARYLNEDLSRA